MIPENIIFVPDVYNYYVKLYFSSFEKPRSEMYVIGKLAHELALNRIFTKSCREVGSGNAFFYNANRVGLTAVIEEKTGLNWQRFTLMRMAQ